MSASPARTPVRTSDDDVEPAASGRPVVVDIYARLSRNPNGELEKVDVQLADCRAVAARNGWTVATEHADNSLSAWRRGVRRPGWEEMLGRVERGEIEGIVVWHTDRLLRQPRDLEKLIDLGSRGLRVASCYGDHDLGNSDDRFMLRVLTASACKASDDTSRRGKRRMATMRENGRAHAGGRSFAFPGNHRRTGEPVPAELVARERAALRTASEQLAAGVSLRQIVTGWNDQGLLTASGVRWVPASARNALTRGRNAGLIEHKGVVVGRVEDDDDPIVSEELYERVCAVFKSRRRGRVSGERYLSSGLVFCGRCGTALSGRPHYGPAPYPDGEPRRQYRCATSRAGCGNVAGDQRAIDERVREIVVALLADPRHVANLGEKVHRASKRLAEIDAELAAAQGTADSLGDRLGRGEIELSTFDAAHRPLSKRLATLRAERETLAGIGTGATEIHPAPVDVVEETWNRAELDERRAMVRRALGGRRIVLRPTGRRFGNRFDRSRVGLADESAEQ